MFWSKYDYRWHTEKTMKYEFTRLMAKAYGRKWEFDPDWCDFSVGERTTGGKRTITASCDGETVESEFYDSQREMKLNIISRDIIEPIVMQLLPDDREFAIERLAYVADENDAAALIGR